MTRTDGNAARAPIAKARDAMARRDWLVAIDLWTEAASITPTRQVFRGLSRAHLKRKDYDAATKVLRSALGHFPDNVAFLGLLGETLMYRRLWHEAVPVWEAHITADAGPPAVSTVLALAAAYRRLGREQDAAALLDGQASQLVATYDAQTAAVLNRGRAALPETPRGVYWISGPSGTGKTTVGRLLGALGYETVDGDKELGRFVRKDTNEPVGVSAPYPVTAEFLSLNVWTWDFDRLREILASCPDDTVFVFGGASKVAQALHLFSATFRLQASPDVIRKRLQSRDPARYADGSPALAKVMRRVRKLPEESSRAAISAEQPPLKVALEILQGLSASNSGTKPG